MEYPPGTRDPLEYPAGRTDEDRRLEQIVEALVNGGAIGPIVHFPSSEGAIASGWLGEAFQVYDGLCAIYGVRTVVQMRPPQFIAEARELTESPDDLMLYIISPPAAE